MSPLGAATPIDSPLPQPKGAALFSVPFSFYLAGGGGGGGGGGGARVGGGGGVVGLGTGTETRLGTGEGGLGGGGGGGGGGLGAGPGEPVGCRLGASQGGGVAAASSSLAPLGAYYDAPTYLDVSLGPPETTPPRTTPPPTTPPSSDPWPQVVVNELSVVDVVVVVWFVASPAHLSEFGW